jgi:hypothetical protein
MPDNNLLSIYKMMKAKGIITEEKPEYEAMIRAEEEEKKHSEEFINWFHNLTSQEQEDFNYAFLTNYQ